MRKGEENARKRLPIHGQEIHTAKGKWIIEVTDAQMRTGVEPLRYVLRCKHLPESVPERKFVLRIDEGAFDEWEANGDSEDILSAIKKAIGARIDSTEEASECPDLLFDTATGTLIDYGPGITG